MHRWFAPPRASSGALMVVLLALPAAAQVPLTLAEAQRLATARSPQLVSQQAMVDAAREMAVPAGELPDPKLIAGFDNVPVSGPDRWTLNRDFMTMTRIGVMQDFPGAGKRQLRSQRAEREAQKGEAALASAALAARREAAAAWFARHYALAAERAVAQQIEQADLAVVTVGAAYRAGKATQSELLASQATVLELRNRATETAMQARRAQVALARYVGAESDRPLGPAPDLARLPFDARTLADVDRQPEIRAAEAQEALALTDSEIARAARKPDWSAELTYQIRGSDYPNMVSLMFRIDLPWSPGTRQDREVAARLREVDAARAMREDARRMRAAEVQQMQVEWEAALAQARRIRTELIPLARQRSEAALAAYRSGAAPVALVLEAGKAELDAELMLISMEQAAAKAWAWLANVVAEGEPS